MAQDQTSQQIKHWHVCLGANESTPIVDYILYDGPASVTAFIDLCQNLFRKEFAGLDRGRIESELLAHCSTDIEQSAIMRLYGFVVMWVPCSGCKSPSLN